MEATMAFDSGNPMRMALTRMRRSDVAWTPENQENMM